MSETKKEVRARINELNLLIQHLAEMPEGCLNEIGHRINELEAELVQAPEDLNDLVLRSHKAVCKAKNMDEKAAYGNDPSLYYSMAVVGEGGELANAIVKSLRNGAKRAKILEAVESELPDVIIYAFVLAFVNDIDLVRLVAEKVDIVCQRAVDGYYGGPLAPDVPGSLSK